MGETFFFKFWAMHICFDLLHNKWTLKIQVYIRLNNLKLVDIQSRRSIYRAVQQIKKCHWFSIMNAHQTIVYVRYIYSAIKMGRGVCRMEIMVTPRRCVDSLVNLTYPNSIAFDLKLLHYYPSSLMAHDLIISQRLMISAYYCQVFMLAYFP